MSLTRFLPFPRGTTWKDGNTATTAGVNNGLPAQSFYSVDKDRPAAARHGTNIDEELIVLRNRTSAAISSAGGTKNEKALRRLYKMAKATSSFGTITTNCIFGEDGYPLDDSYTTQQQIAVGDDAYFIRKGPCRLTLITATSGGSPGTTVLIARTGGLVGPQCAGGLRKRPIAVAMETFTATAGQRTILCLMGAEFANADTDEA